MVNDLFSSSDSQRSAKPLKHLLTKVFAQPLELELEGTLPEVTVAYETYGKLNADNSNAVLVCHALSGDSHVARHDQEDDTGWWDIVVGPGKAIDTDKYFVICSNILGGCRGTTGPNSINPETKRPYGSDFPTITIIDMVQDQNLLVESLGIERLHAVIGGSMGGQQALVWATRFPEQVRLAVPIATCARLSMQALAFDVVGRNSILRDPNFDAGQYYAGAGPQVGLALARMLGHITYLSPEAMQEKFQVDHLSPRDVPTEFEKRFSVGSYLAYQGNKFVERFDANSYISLTLAMDLFNLGRDSEELRQTLSGASCNWLFISYTSDWLFPPEQSQELVNVLASLGKPVSYCNVKSNYGHDAFLLKDELRSYGRLIAAALDNTNGECKRSFSGNNEADFSSPKSIFHSQRLDYARITALIPPWASVLDLGCGVGTLLEKLRGHGNKILSGLELDEEAVICAVERGFNVIQADLNLGLKAFEDRQYDYVVLSHTLQAIKDVERVMNDMLRIGKHCIVSFPNFGYYKLRHMLEKEGRAPESLGLLRYKWYNSPNIRFFTIQDFLNFCQERNIQVHQCITLDTEEEKAVTEDPNRWADMAICVISK